MLVQDGPTARSFKVPGALLSGAIALACIGFLIWLVSRLPGWLFG